MLNSQLKFLQTVASLAEKQQMLAPWVICLCRPKYVTLNGFESNCMGIVKITSDSCFVKKNISAPS